MNANSSALSSPPTKRPTCRGWRWLVAAATACVAGVSFAATSPMVGRGVPAEPRLTGDGSPYLGSGTSHAIALGANVNESLTNLEPALLDRAHVSWVRGFVPASEFIDGQRRFDTDPGLRAVRAAAESGRHVIVTIKWDLQKQHQRVPAPGSAEEARWFAFAAGLARSMAGHIDILGLINEVFIDTMPEDLEPANGGDAPMLVFLERLADYLQHAKLEGRAGAPLELYAGGFTRLDLPRMQHSPTVAALAHWLSTSPDIAGVDLHLHQSSYGQMEQALAFLRAKIPNKPFIVTEYSLIWRFKAHMSERLAATPAGHAFAETYRLSPDLKVYEFLNQALAHPVAQAEWHAFLASRPWFDPQFFTHAGALMARHGVTIATYGFSQGDKRYPHQSAESVPWLLNPIYVQQVATSADRGRAAVNYGLFDDFVRLQSAAR